MRNGQSSFWFLLGGVTVGIWLFGSILFALFAGERTAHITTGYLFWSALAVLTMTLGACLRAWRIALGAERESLSGNPGRQRADTGGQP